MRINPIKLKKDKKAILGSLPSLFIATVLIVLILAVFALFSGAMKLFTWKVGEDKTVSVQGSEVGLSNIKDYMVVFGVAVQEKYMENKDKAVDQLKEEFGK